MTPPSAAPARDRLHRMLAEAQRAPEVVRRLRDIFRHGTTRLERVSLAELLERVRRPEAAVRAGCAVPITLEVEPGLNRERAPTPAELDTKHALLGPLKNVVYDFVSDGAHFRLLAAPAAP